MPATAAPVYCSRAKVANCALAPLRQSRLWLLSVLFLHCLVFQDPALPGLQAQSSSLPIASIEFEGNKSISTQQLKRQLHMAAPGNLYTSQGLESDLRRLEKEYQDEGFLRAAVGPPDVQIQTSGNRNTAAIRIPIAEGSRYVSGRVSVKNTKALAADSILQLYPMPQGQPYRRGLIVQWRDRIGEVYASLGYVRAQCTIHESLNDGEKTVDCTLDCSEGKSYRVGKINVAGDESIDAAKFKHRLLLSEGGTFNPENLALSVQFLNQSGLYQRISNTDIEMVIDDARSLVDLTFHIFSKKQ